MDERVRVLLRHLRDAIARQGDGLMVASQCHGFLLCKPVLHYVANYEKCEARGEQSGNQPCWSLHQSLNLLNRTLLGQNESQEGMCRNQLPHLHNVFDYVGLAEVGNAVPSVDPVGRSATGKHEPKLFRAIHQTVLVDFSCSVKGRGHACVVTISFLLIVFIDILLDLLFLLDGQFLSLLRSSGAPTFKINIGFNQLRIAVIYLRLVDLFLRIPFVVHCLIFKFI